MPGKAWTTEQEEKLKELAASGNLSAAQIGHKLGTTRNSVIAKMQRLRVPSLYKSKLQESNFNKIIKKKRAKNPEKRIQSFNYMNHGSFKSPTIFSKKLDELLPNDCRWPVDDNGRVSNLFCARNTCGTYCQEHSQLAYSKKSNGPKIKYVKMKSFLGMHKYVPLKEAQQLMISA